MIDAVTNWSACIAGSPKDPTTNRLRYANSQACYRPNHEDGNQDFYPEFLPLAHSLERIVGVVALALDHDVTGWPHGIIRRATLWRFRLCVCCDS